MSQLITLPIFKGFYKGNKNSRHKLKSFSKQCCCEIIQNYFHSLVMINFIQVI